jgi:hypothetical protein
MRNKIFAALALTASLVLSSTASASLLLTDEHDYTSGYDPGGSGALSSGGVAVSDQNSVRFSDYFDLSSLGSATIDSIVLTLEFAGAGPNGFFGFGETWGVRAQGSNSGSSADDTFSILFDSLSAQSFTYNALTDTANTSDAFAHSVSTSNFAFWFSEFTSGSDGFTLSAATLQVFGTEATAVSEPAAAALVGLGAFAMFARRKRTKLNPAQPA